MSELCYEENCIEESIIECLKCDGRFCYQHYNKNHPEGKCIHF